jgi:8-oxo-dGTP pyrophosphatase MutT (NUDIX family)
MSFDKERKNGDWIIKETRVVFSNDFFKVFEDQVIQPDGKDGSYAVIKFKQGAAVLPVDDDGNIYLTKQFRYAIEREDLEVAAGVVEVETFLEAAKRESLEELGIEAEEWTDFGMIEENTSVTNSVIKIYLAQKLTFTAPKPEGTEKIEVVKMPLKKALSRVMKGEITHDLTCILIMKTSLYLKEVDFAENENQSK